MKAKKTMLTKMIAVFAIVAMMLSMSMTAFAISSTDQGDFTVSGLDTTVNPQVTAYQIITVNIDNASGQPAYPMYTWNSEVALWLKANSYSTYVDDTLGTNAVADVFDAINADTETEFLEKLTAAIKNGSVNVTASKEVTAAEGSAAFTDMDMGVYLITANGGVKIYQPTTVELVPAYDEDAQAWVLSNATATMKSNDPSITKTVDDPQVAIGDTVTYTITAYVPDYPENATNTSFIVSDKIDAGLTFDGINTIAVYSDVDKQNVVATNNYDVTTENIEGRTFQISFHDDFTTTTTADTLYITYTATVSANAFGTNVLGNDAYLKYNNDPYAVTTRELADDVDVYTYGITVDKVDKNHTPLAGAKFKVTKDGTPLKFSVTGTDGIYIPDADADADADEVEVSAAGVLQLQGLDVGTYVLTETVAPPGYVLPTGSITVVIADADVNGEIDNADVTNTGTVQVDEIVMAQNITSFDVINISSDDAGFTLPVTGGMGTMIFTILGIALMASAAAMIIVSRKKRA